MRHCILNGSRDVNDCFVFFLWLPYIQNSIAHINGIIHFRSRKTFRTVLEREVSFGFVCQFFQKHRTVNGNLFNLLLGFFKYLFTLCNRCGVVQMNNCVRSTFYSLKCFFDNVLSCLSQNLNGNIIRNHIFLNQSTHKFVFSFRCSRETNFDFLESNIY